MRGYLISWLARRAAGAGLTGFLEERPEDWLVWEAGPWRPTYQNRETLEQEGARSSVPQGIGESLAIALEPRPDRPYVSLGRAPDNDLVIDDATLSRLHLLLERRPEGWAARDAGSTNGTWIEGERLGPDPVVLVTGTQILAGSVRFTFYDAGGLYLRLRGAP